jgi:5-methylcytosine-specific restriction endonuclease McrA
MTSVYVIQAGDGPAIISRAQARAAGLDRYFTGQTCRRGHIAERRVSNCACIPCEAARGLAWRAANPEKSAAIYAKHKAANRETIQKQRAAYRAANAEKLRADNAARRALDPEKNRASKLRYRLAYPEKRANLERNRRARLRAAEGFHTDEDIARIYEAQKGRCACCQSKISRRAPVDHIHPLARGGSNWPKNLQILCKPCNSSKKDKDPLEFMQSLGLLL